MALSSFDIDAPRWDQSTFMGRLKHFFNITDWRTVALSNSRLDEAKALVESCRWIRWKWGKTILCLTLKILSLWKKSASTSSIRTNLPANSPSWRCINYPNVDLQDISFAFSEFAKLGTFAEPKLKQKKIAMIYYCLCVFLRKASSY